MFKLIHASKCDLNVNKTCRKITKYIFRDFRGHWNTNLKTCASEMNNKMKTQRQITSHEFTFPNLQPSYICPGIFNWLIYRCCPFTINGFLLY